VNRELIRLMLEPLEVRVTEAASGAEAVRLAEGVAFDLILMDIRMPEMDGRQATRIIRAGRGANRHSRIVALTADVEPDNLAACREVGIDRVLPKPISPQGLLGLVWECAQTRTQPPAAARPGRRKRKA
jgi:CheY-like chemotaxis protein